MANISVAWNKIEPSFVEPEIMLKYVQASGNWDLLGGGKPIVKLGEGDLYAYIKYLDIRSKAALGQVAYNSLPSATIIGEFIGTASYLLRTRSEFDHHDTAALGKWGVNIVSAQELARRQGIFQLMRTLNLYGANPGNNEGLINQVGATAVTLPPDTNGHTTASTYDAGQMAVFLLTQIRLAGTRMFQLGMPGRVVFCGPQEVLGLFEWNIVQVTSYQRIGGGSNSTRGAIKGVAGEAGFEVDWTYDDTLIGKGIGGTDLIIMTVPEIHVPSRPGSLSTGVFNDLQPSMTDMVRQYVDMAAPRDLPAPLPAGAIDITSEMRATSGWAPRPEAITLISMAP